MTPRERFIRTMNFDMPDDRLPMIEWAAWWDKTIERWKGEGLPADYSREDALEHFGLDRLDILRGVPRSTGCPKPEYHGAGLIQDEIGYEAIHNCLFTDDIIEQVKSDAVAIKE